MTHLSRITLAFALATGIASVASAQIVSQDFTFEIEAMTTMTLGAAPATAIIRAPVSQLDSAAMFASGGVLADTVYSSYNFYSNVTFTKTITAHISAGVLPVGTSLYVQLAAPTGATSTGLVGLSATPVNVVTGIGATYGNSLQILYQFAALSSAAPITDDVTITYTVELPA